jgi:hypothetical protein
VSALRLVAVAVLVCTSGCRFTDPFYAFQPMRADEPSEQGFSLVTGSFEVEPGLLWTPVIDTVALKQISPETDRKYRFATENTLFRVFQNRVMKDGHFIVEVPPGMYQLEHLESHFLGQPTRYTLTEGAAISSRIYVTRPGIYDLGVIRIGSSGIGRMEMAVVDAPDSPERKRAFLEAIAGTTWEQFVSR